MGEPARLLLPSQDPVTPEKRLLACAALHILAPHSIGSSKMQRNTARPAWFETTSSSAPALTLDSYDSSLYVRFPVAAQPFDQQFMQLRTCKLLWQSDSDTALFCETARALRLAFKHHKGHHVRDLKIFLPRRAHSHRLTPSRVPGETEKALLCIWEHVYQS